MGLAIIFIKIYCTVELFLGWLDFICRYTFDAFYCYQWRVVVLGMIGIENEVLNNVLWNLWRSFNVNSIWMGKGRNCSNPDVIPFAIRQEIQFLYAYPCARARWHYLCTTDVWTLRVNMCKYLSSLALPVAFNHPALLYARQPPSMGLRLCNVCAVNVHRARETRFVFWLPFVHWISYFSLFFLINYSHLHV